MILGDGIRFRTVERDDLPRYVSWFNDPEVRQGLSMYLPMGLWEEEQWFETLADRPPDQRPMAMDIQSSDGWEHVGGVGIFDIDSRVHSGEVGISIGAKEYWNKGYGTRAMRLVLKHAFETLNLNRVALRVFANNLRAIRCYQKAGFIEEGRMRQAYFADGEYVDILWMSVLRQEWDGGKEGK